MGRPESGPVRLESLLREESVPKGEGTIRF